jgi:hypothetical protein
MDAICDPRAHVVHVDALHLLDEVLQRGFRRHPWLGAQQDPITDDQQRRDRQAWLGHCSVEVTARYLHHLGDSADSSAPGARNTKARGQRFR